MTPLFRTLSCLAALAAASSVSAYAADAVAVAPAPALHAAEDTLARPLRDDRGGQVALRVPRALFRDANAFRLYGMRPLTLRSRDRRRDLYRDAFLEVATRSRLTPATTAWDPLSRQWDWLGAQSVHVPGIAAPVPVLPPSVREGAEAASRWTADLRQKVESAAGTGQLGSLTRALGAQALGKAGTVVELSSPVATTLQLRALATDQAEQRLQLLGRALRLASPGTDPAMRDGFRAAQSEFDEVRQGLWPAIAGCLQRHEGQLLLSAVKSVALSRLSMWAIFGQMAWQSAESAVNAEYSGQYSICLATLACTLEDPTVAGADPAVAQQALYTEFAMNYQLTETFKDGQVLMLKPAGGLTTGEWEIRHSSRCQELKKALVPG